MNLDNSYLWTIEELGRAYRNGVTTPVEILARIEDRIDRLDERLTAFVTRTSEIATTQAARATEELAKGVDRGPLHGVPLSLKDLVEVAGVRTTGGSGLLKDHVPDRNAGLVDRLDESGAVLLGKNSTYEFGLGLPMEGDWADPAKNPWDLTRIPGGSSSGSAAAVFAGLSFGAFGTDTGGSIRGPAAYCGVVGLKPTKDLIDVAGVLPLSATLDHVGPLGRTVGDVRALLAGSSTTAYEIPSELVPLSEITFGLDSKMIESASFGDGVVESFHATVDLIRRAGAEVQEVEWPPTGEVETALKSIIGHEAYAIHHETLSSKPGEYGPSAYERLSSGAEVSSDDLERALAFREHASAFMAELFGRVDFLVSPVTHTTAATFVDYAASPTPRTLFTGLFNLIGAPALSLPGGLDANLMPIGLQVAGPPHSDSRLLDVAESIEALVGFPAELSHDAAELRSP